MSSGGATHVGGERVDPFATKGPQLPRRRPIAQEARAFRRRRIFFRPPATLLTMPSKPIAVRVPATLEGSRHAATTMRRERLEHFSGGFSGNDDSHAVYRWYLELDLSSRADRLLLAVQPARHVIHRRTSPPPSCHPGSPANPPADRIKGRLQCAWKSAVHRIPLDDSARNVDGSSREADQVPDHIDATPQHTKSRLIYRRPPMRPNSGQSL
jgi:hypothetical protein